MSRATLGWAGHGRAGVHPAGRSEGLRGHLGQGMVPAVPESGWEIPWETDLQAVCGLLAELDIASSSLTSSGDREGTLDGLPVTALEQLSKALGIDDPG